MTVLNYNGSAADMKSFMNEEVDVAAHAPADSKRSLGYSVECSQNSEAITKKTIIQYLMNDGSTAEVVVEQTMPL